MDIIKLMQLLTDINVLLSVGNKFVVFLYLANACWWTSTAFYPGGQNKYSRKANEGPIYFQPQLFLVIHKPPHLKLFVSLGPTADFDTIVPTHLAVPTVVAQEQ